MSDETPAPQPTTSDPKQTDSWSSVIASKEFAWFIAKATAGIQAAPLAVPWLHSLGLTIEPNTVASALLPAVLGAILHASQDFAALKTQSKWL